MLCSKAQDISAAAKADEAEPQESTKGSVVAAMLQVVCSSESAGLPSPLGTEGDLRGQCKLTEQQTFSGSKNQCRDDAEYRAIHCKDAVDGRLRKSP